MRKEPLESRGLRLPPRVWRKIERLADMDETDRSTWLREQIEALLSRVPDVHDTHDPLPDAKDRELVEVLD